MAAAGADFGRAADDFVGNGTLADHLDGRRVEHAFPALPETGGALGAAPVGRPKAVPPACGEVAVLAALAGTAGGTSGVENVGQEALPA